MVGLKIEDLQLLLDSINIIRKFYKTDSGIGNDEIITNIKVILSELSQTVEEISISNYLTIDDIGYGLDKLLRILYIYCFNLHIIKEQKFNGNV
jgi:hypothetical protein